MNPMDFMKNLQSMQGQLKDIQEKMQSITAEGTAGGGMVRIKLTGQFSVLSVEIDPEVVDPSDVEMLQDLILAAYTDAAANVREKIQQEAGSLAGGMGMPPGFPGM